MDRQDFGDAPQTFAPGEPVTVELRYRPSVGMSFDTVLRKGLRDNAAIAQDVKRHRAAYCVPTTCCGGSTGSLALPRRTPRECASAASATAHDRRELARADQGFQAGRRRAGRTGWSAFASTTWTNIMPTAFEVRMKDFTPERDLRILLIGKAD